MADLPIIEHEILGVLYHRGTLTITGTGSQLTGQYPLDAELGAVPMHYGAIAALLNNPKKFDKKVEDLNLNYYQDLAPTREQVEETPMRFTWRDITDTLDILESKAEVIFLDPASFGMDRRRIQLSKAGKIAYKTKKYLKEKDEDEYSTKLAKSQIATNSAIVSTGKWTKFLFFATLATALATLALVIVPAISDDEKSSLKHIIADKDSLIRQLQNQLLKLKNPQPQAKVEVDSSGGK